jgi:cytoskeleton protein RodZ
MAESVGEQLKKARLDRGLTLLEASHQTRIRVHYLEALENDRRDLLPSAVQGRGFLRLYAEFLRLPAAALVDTWDYQSGVQPQPAAHTISPGSEKETTSDTLEPEEAVADTESVQEVEAPLVAENMSSEMILLDLGRRLRRQRESLNLKISDVERFTHLREKYIDALEKGDIDDLPSPVQGRGMLSVYARFLNMDDEAMLLRFADALQARLVERTAPKVRSGWFLNRPPRQSKGWMRLLTPDLVLGSLVIISLFGFAIWSAAQVSAIRDETEAEPSLIPISNLMLTVSPEAETVFDTPLPAATQLPPELAALVANPESDAEIELTSTLPAIGDAPLQLYIIANRRAFLQVISDKREVFNGRVVPGNAYLFSGRDEIELITGNAAALQVFYNQEDLGILGGVGQVVHLVFIPGGITTPTPSASATPTPTLPATATMMPSPTAPTPTITIFVP